MAIFSAISIILLGFIPAVVSLWLLKQQFITIPRYGSLSLSQRESQFHSARRQGYSSPPNLPIDSYYLVGIGYLIGDITCEFNARSAYLRCAVNPLGFCSECKHYQPKDI